MELFEEILAHHLKKNESGFPADPQALVHDTAYQALKAIRLILERDDLEDAECFRRIERIVGCTSASGAAAVRGTISDKKGRRAGYLLRAVLLHLQGCTGPHLTFTACVRSALPSTKGARYSSSGRSSIHG